MGPVCTKPEESTAPLQNTIKPVALRDLPTGETTETITVTVPAPIIEEGVKAIPPPE